MSVEGNKANVDFGQGVLREVNVSLVEAKVGDYVLVHAGYAIQVVEEKEAIETLRFWNEILEAGKNKRKLAMGMDENLQVQRPKTGKKHSRKNPRLSSQNRKNQNLPCLRHA